MKKYIAVQVNPEYQESPLLLDIDSMEGTYLEGLCFWGNSCYKAHVTDKFNSLLDNLDDATEDFLAIVEEQDYKNFDTVEEIVRNYFTYSGNDWNKWAEVFQMHYRANFCPKESVLVAGLSLLTGKTYDYKQIRGSSQSEWNNIFFPADEWTDKQIRNIEVEYFNEGAEYIITIEPVDEDTSPEDVVCFDTVSVYVHGWTDEQERQELAEVNGCKPEEIIMYKWAIKPVVVYTKI